MRVRHVFPAVLAGALLLGAGVGAATKPKPNDGLPTKWYGFTSFDARGFTLTGTFAEVTLTLKKKQAYTKKAAFTVGAKGTFYSYVPSGPITVWGHCGPTPVKTTLAANDGVLLVAVPKGSPARARYYGKDVFTLLRKLPGTCPGGFAPEPRIFTWGFLTYESKPMPVGRRINTSAKDFRGEYVDPSSGLNTKYEWCFTRLKNSGTCLDVTPPGP